MDGAIDGRRRVERDWLVTKAHNRLHHATLSDPQLAPLGQSPCVPGPIELSCGQTATSVSLPGQIGQRKLPRCANCCVALGYPAGIGSPQLDAGCRPLLGVSRWT